MSENKKNMTNEELEKLKEKDMDKVSGGYFGFDKDHTDGHELTCVFSTTFHKKMSVIKVRTATIFILRMNIISGMRPANTATISETRKLMELQGFKKERLPRQAAFQTVDKVSPLFLLLHCYNYICL